MEECTGHQGLPDDSGSDGLEYRLMQHRLASLPWPFIASTNQSCSRCITDSGRPLNRSSLRIDFLHGSYLIKAFQNQGKGRWGECQYSSTQNQVRACWDICHRSSIKIQMPKDEGQGMIYWDDPAVRPITMQCPSMDHTAALFTST